jgi:hypothetical protein
MPGGRPWQAWLGLVLLVSLWGVASAQGTDADLRAFAKSHGITRANEFVETVTRLREASRLPPRYITKREAERLGWQPGANLCGVAPGRTIGGDTFGNREKRLPEAANRRWREADLDYACGRRNAKRLVWSSDGLIFVTVDHYQSFHTVPR